MSKKIWQLLKVAPAACGASLLVANNALAQVPAENQIRSESEILEQLNRYSNEGQGSSIDQVNSVFQLRDVSPGDWAFEALRNLVERYGCIAGYPDGTYRGNQPMTRYEFAAGLNACLQQIENLIATGGATGTTRGVTSTDLETLERLVQEFNAELATLGTRVDNLEGRVTGIEETQFSTTTKLGGEVVFIFADLFGDAVGTDDDIEYETTLQARVRLNFDTSFTGEDRLRTRFQFRNVNGSGSESSGTDMTRLNLRGDTDGDFELDILAYRFPLGDQITAHLAAANYDIDDVFDPVNPLSSSGGGSLSRFGDRNPLTHRSDAAGSGVGFNIDLSESIALDLTYQTSEAADPSTGSGLFNGDFSAGAQLNFGLGGADLALTYLYTYQGAGDVNFSGSTGSEIAQDPFSEVFGVDVATSGHRFGLSGAAQLGSRVLLGGFFGYAIAQAEEDGPGTPAVATTAGFEEGDEADIFTASLNLSFLDIGREGAALSIIGGIPPKATSVGDNDDPEEDTSFLLELQYKLPINDNIEVTPGAYVIFSPQHDSTNDDIYVGAIRTRFRF